MTLKVHIWMNFRSHHQSHFFNSLIEHGVDLKVTYYEHVSADRLALGWSNEAPTNTWESSLSELAVHPRQRLLELADYIHIIPGYGTSLLRQLAIDASKLGVKWCHWSETSWNGIRWWMSYPIKKWYAKLLNRYGIGAFAQGTLARLDFMRWGIDPSKIADLTYSVRPAIKEAPTDRRITDFANGRSVFLFLGSLNHNKAIDVQLKAFAKIKTKNWCLIFVGNKNPQKYIELATRLNLTDRVLFLPPVDWNKVSEIHQASDVLLLPSRHDGWGGVANEAAAHSKALILSTNCGAAWHLIEPGINGFLVKPGAVDSLANAMSYYVNGGRQLAALHGQESERISRAYTSDASARRLIKTLQSWLAL